MRLSKTLGFVSVLALVAMGAGAVADDDHGRSDDFHFGRDHDHDDVRTRTPIKHVVVIFQENISFDHYFGTYPHAQNKQGETPFSAKPFTPAVNSLKTPLDVNHTLPRWRASTSSTTTPTASRPTRRPPIISARNRPSAVSNGANASNPFRLTPAQALTADQGHNEQPEQARLQQRPHGRLPGLRRHRRARRPPASAPRGS